MNQKNLWLRECSCKWHVLVIRWLVHEVTAQKATRTHLNGFSLLTLTSEPSLKSQLKYVTYNLFDVTVS